MPEELSPMLGDNSTTESDVVKDNQADPNKHRAQESIGATLAGSVAGTVARGQEYGNGYHFPPKYSWGETIKQGLIDFWAFYNTGFGFFLTIYSLNIVAWGGMLFLLLCNASSVMCQGDCNAIDSPRRVWIEVDSQILNALFCVTGFGLAPWRFRDLWLLLKFRVKKDIKGLREVAGVHRGWFRLPGSEDLPVHLGPKNIEETDIAWPEASVPFPLETIPDAPPTGIRAPATKLWKLDLIIWLNVANTLLQVCLSTFMWALNRYDRPSWSTGLFVCLACIAAAVAGIYMGIEGKHVKSIEGVPLTKRDRERLAKDAELGIPHWNNLKDKDPEEKENKKKAKKIASHEDKTA
ncbi:hypothetical protein BKA67DRAFT_76125 [Truncatella angustata]|uniref:Uncharacterized protein n=1 Tax=Truncatella angustata TaxID=152316 RepID=A0A9P8V0B5_9PEZI|nr:uncharacterized protein BKA67DRAFT_76125 [Truncatella angustata]KAH6661139.1 hypothetical protein BKA67DRAFT_76125 [Truncatella angustata]KAH8202471.1 hypothetical protein TruAng_003371 [Truncatella angustata]